MCGGAQRSMWQGIKRCAEPARGLQRDAWKGTWRVHRGVWMGAWMGFYEYSLSI